MSIKQQSCVEAMKQAVVYFEHMVRTLKLRDESEPAQLLFKLRQAIDAASQLPEAAVAEQHEKHSATHGEPVAMQMDVIVVNLVREGINKHRARELAEHFIKHTHPYIEQPRSNHD
jgi:hypothetical protein